VDRRSRERFIESSSQIAALVDKFRVQGDRYRRREVTTESPLAGQPPDSSHALGRNQLPSSIPLTAYGRPSSLQVLWALVARQISASFSSGGLCRRLFLLPFAFTLLCTVLLPRLELYQHSLQTRAFLLFNCMALINCVSAPAAAYQLAAQRDRYYEESSRLRLYRGPLLIFSQMLAALPFDLVSVGAASAALYWLVPLRTDALWPQRFALLAATYWALHTLAQQVAISLLAFVRSRFVCSALSIAFLNTALVAGGGLLRNTLTSVQSWLPLVNLINPFFYAGFALQFNELHDNSALDRLPALGEDLRSILPCPVNVLPGRCLFLNGTHFLAHRYREGVDASKHLLPEFSLLFWRNFALLHVIVLGAFAVTSIVYVLPLPASLKAKFRD
jgi:ATP-binding cassette subfamily G (WHITE) protein 5 (sterolin 1)